MRMGTRMRIKRMWGEGRRGSRGGGLIDQRDRETRGMMGNGLMAREWLWFAQTRSGLLIPDPSHPIPLHRCAPHLCTCASALAFAAAAAALSSPLLCVHAPRHA